MTEGSGVEGVTNRQMAERLALTYNQTRRQAYATREMNKFGVPIHNPKIYQNIIAEQKKYYSAIRSYFKNSHTTLKLHKGAMRLT